MLKEICGVDLRNAYEYERDRQKQDYMYFCCKLFLLSLDIHQGTNIYEI